MNDVHRERKISGLIGGTLLLLVGALFVLQNLGFADAGRIGDYWPLLLVWVGLSRLLTPGPSRHFGSGLVVLLLGVFFQLDRLGVFWIRRRDVWPFILVIAGVALIAEALTGRARARSLAQDEASRS